MDFDLGEQAAALRHRLRALINEHIAEDYLGAFTSDPADLEVAQRFCRMLADEGLLTITWPTEYGGAGGSLWDQTVVREEMWAHHEPRGAQYMGLNWVGPAIMAYGTEAQKQQHLSAIAHGEVIWCQGFSEPEAGSDLASLKTRAVEDGDGWRLTGQKIWTSYAGMAQWCVLAARVGPGERHEGITMFLVPMDAPGITVRPIRSMLGHHHLNEVFFDDVWAGPDAVLGGIGEGWAVIRKALAHERVGIARYARCERLLSALGAELRPHWSDLPTSLHAQWARALVQVRVARLLAYRTVHAQATGELPDVHASTARIAVTQCDQSVAEVLFQALEDGALEAGPSAPLHGAVEDHWRYAQAATVASGTIEVQRMIVSKALLGGWPVNPVLPDEAVEYRAAANKAFAALGGVEVARRAEDDPAVRSGEVAATLAALGTEDLDPRADADSLAAAAALCEAAGRVALPYPLPATLLRDDASRPFAVVPDRHLRVDHADLFPTWRIASLNGPSGTATPVGPRLATRLGPFVGDVALDASEAHAAHDLQLHVALTGWQVLGTVDRAVELAVEHVNGRIQFGKPIASFQAVQFQLADCAVAVAGLRELAGFTLWRLDAAPGAALADVLALRVHAIDVARTVLRTCQQLHGAAGVCDEYDISVLTRMVQPALRLPWSAERTATSLADAIQGDGFEGLFAHGGRGPVTTFDGPALDGFPGVGALTLGGFLDEVAARFGPNEALVFDDPLLGGTTVRWTYAQLREEARRIGRALLAVGVERGDAVGVLMGNRPEAVAALFGAAMAGAVAVPMSTFAPRPELAHMVEAAGVTIVLTQANLLGRRFGEDLDALAPDLPDLGEVVVLGDPGWRRFLAAGDTVTDADLDERAAAGAPDDPALVIFSSGTTSVPKGMLHGHRAPTLQFWVQAQIFGRHEGTRMWSALPLFWTAGLNTAMGSTLAAGGCWVVQEAFEPGEALELIARERVTEPYTLPHQTAALEEHPGWVDADLSSLTCVFGKGPFARHPTVHGDQSWLMPVGYGLSETCAFFCSHWSDATREATRRSMGQLLPGNRLRVVDPDTGAALGVDEEGELAISGPTLMLHYLGKAPAECFDADGFFRTGDAGHVDQHGEVHFSGRRTEMIKTGGANVSPAELEVQLRACPPVKLSRIVGVPDPRLDQLVVACITLKDGAEATVEEIQAFLRERVAAYKVPKRVLFFEDGEIPMTSSDTKVRDDALIALVQDRLAATPVPTASGDR